MGRGYRKRVGNDVGKSLRPDLTGGNSGMHTQESGQVLVGTNSLIRLESFAWLWAQGGAAVQHVILIKDGCIYCTICSGLPTSGILCSVLEAHLKRAFCKLRFSGGYHHYIRYRSPSYIFLAIFFLLESISLWFSTWNRHVFPSSKSLSFFFVFFQTFSLGGLRMGNKSITMVPWCYEGTYAQGHLI